MKLPQTFSLRRILIHIRALNPGTKRLILLSTVVIACFALVLPFINTRGRQAEQAAVTPKAVSTVSPLQSEVKEPLSAAPKALSLAAATSQTAGAPQPKALSARDFRPPLTGSELRGTSKTLIWWDVLGDYRLHPGVDLEASPGTKVSAAASGTVTELGTDPVYGKVLVLDHGGGWQTVYGQLDSIQVKLHATVKSGQLLALVGQPVGGEADMAPHLHYEILYNQQIVNGQRAS